MNERDALALEGASPRDRLILEHVPLLRHIAGRMSLDLPSGVDREDLEAVGMLGLVAAADSWEPERGLQFSTYAYPRIRGAILDELRRQDFLPRGRREKVRELDRAFAALEQATGVPPTPEELAAHLGIPIDQIDETLLAARMSTQASLDDGPSDELQRMVRDPRCDDPVDSASWTEMKALLVRAIDELPDAEKTVITLYYGEELLLKEIGEVLSVTESRVSQIHSRALYRLNCGLSAAIGSS